MEGPKNDLNRLVGFETKVYTGIFLIFIMLFPIGMSSVFYLQKIRKEQSQLVDARMTDLQNAGRFRSELSAHLATLPIFLLSVDSKVLEQFDESEKALKEILSTLKSESARDGALVQQIDGLVQQLFKEGHEIIQKRLAGESARHANRVMSAHQEPLKLSDAVSQLVAQRSQALSEAQAQLQHTWMTAMSSLTLISILVFLTTGLIAVLLVRVVRQKIILEQKRQTEFLNEKQLSQVRKEAMEVVAHDLKSPLATIRMGAELINEDIEVVNTPEARQMMNVIFHSIGAMERLISNILMQARIETGSLILNPTVCDVQQVIEEVVEQMQPQATGKNLTLKVDYDQSRPLLVCDEGRVQQILSNLLSNSLKFTPDGGVVRIETRRTDENYMIAVSDTGPGISEKELPHIFERFWQVKKTAAKGTGLGLSIVKSLVEAHRGRVTVESHIGQGSTFRVYLPFQSQVEWI